MNQSNFELFHNSQISRELSPEFVRIITDKLQSMQRIKYKDSSKETFFVLRFTIKELSESI